MASLPAPTARAGPPRQGVVDRVPAGHGQADLPDLPGNGEVETDASGAVVSQAPGGHVRPALQAEGQDPSRPGRIQGTDPGVVPVEDRNAPLFHGGKEGAFLPGPSKDPTPSRWAGPMFVIRAASGQAMAVRRAISPGRFVPSSRTATS